MKNANLDKDDWECIYTCVFREYKRQYAKVLKDALGHKKVLDDTSAQKWLNLLHKIDLILEDLSRFSNLLLNARYRRARQ